MFDDGEGFLFRKTLVEKKGAAAFGKTFATIVALEQADIVVFSVPMFDADISGSSNAVFLALFIPTEEVFQIIHDPAP